jgi:hypothetical protein
LLPARAGRPRRIRDVQHLSLEQHVTAPKSKLSIVDVKCTTASDRRFVVEMQVLPVEGLEGIERARTRAAPRPRGPC